MKKQLLLIFTLLFAIITNSYAQTNYDEQKFTLGKELTTIDELANANFVVIKGHALQSYGENYDTTWVGDRYLATPEQFELEATASSLVKLIPSGEEDCYYIYWVNHNKYLKLGDNFKGTNDWQYSASDLMYSTPVKFVNVDGKFQMSYKGLYEGEHIDFYIATEPNAYTYSNLRYFSIEGKNFIEGGNYIYDFIGIDYPVDFNFTISEANVDESVVDELLSKSINEAKENLASSIENSRFYLEAYRHLVNYPEDITIYEEAISTAENALSESNTVFTDIVKAIKDLEIADIMYVIGVQHTYYDTFIDEKLSNDELFSETPEAGKYPESSKEYLIAARAMLNDVVDVFNGAPFPFTFYDAYSTLYMVSWYINLFEGTYVQDYAELPLVFTKENDKLPGSTIMSEEVGGYDGGVKYTWTSHEIVMEPSAPIDGLRFTFLENNGGTTKSGNGYPGIALDELTLTDDNGNVITISDVTSNAEYGSPAFLAVDNDVNTYYATGNYSEVVHMPSGYAYLELTFAQPVSSFKIKIISNDIELSPASFVITNKGVSYDPRIESPNPYNVVVGEKVTSVSEITDGLYAIRGLQNTHPVWGKDENGKQLGDGNFYTGISRYHSDAKAVRDAQIFYVRKNDDNTVSIQSIATAEYWPTFKNDGYQTGAKSKTNAAKFNIVAAESEELNGTFVLYEKYDNMFREKKIITDSGISYQKVSTPYAVYMDWNKGLAARAVVSPQPGVGSEELSEYIDSYGEDYLFNKKNGEGQWEFYKVTMDNSDYRYLTALVSMAESLRYAEGNEPGLYASLGDYPSILETAKKCVADSVYSEVTANIEALETALASMETLKPNTIQEGKEYMFINGLDEYFLIQGKAKALYCDTDMYNLAWGDAPTERDENYIFTFEKSSFNDDALDLSDEDRANAYLIKNVGTGLYVETTLFDTGITFGEYASVYVTKNVGGGMFNIWHAESGEWYGLHTEGHTSGAGESGKIVYWDGNNSPSSWWKILSVDRALSIEDIAKESLEVESVTYYTTNGTSVPEPISGVNIVVTVYSNGLTETKKILVK